MKKAKGKITSKERILLLNNLSKMLASGVSLRESLSAIHEETERKQFRNILAAIVEEVDEGKPLWRSFKNHRILDQHGLSLLQIGEQSGGLVKNLTLLTKQQEKTKQFNQKIRSALMYPVFVLGLTVVVGSLIAWFVLPRITQIFSSLNAELPAMTRYLISAGNLLRDYGIFVVPSIFIIIGTGIYFLFINDKTKHIGQGILLLTPGIKKLIRTVELARFGYLLGTLLDSGITITDAFAALEESTKLKRYKAFYQDTKRQIVDGINFRTLLRDNKRADDLIARTDQQMIIAAEQSGRLSSTLLEISSRAESETENVLKNISVLLEPIMLVVVWLGVVGVALAVIMPIYQLVSSIN